MGAIVLAVNLETLGFGILQPLESTKCLSDKFRNLSVIVNQSSQTSALYNNIIKIVRMVDEQMGLGIAVVGWACVWTTLEVGCPCLA
jgi:hypothetical protein